MSGFPARSYVYILFLFFLRRYQKTSLDSLRAAPTHLRRAGKDTCVSWLSLQEERGQDSDLGEENMTMAWAKGKVIRPSCFKGLKEKNLTNALENPWEAEDINCTASGKLASGQLWLGVLGQLSWGLWSSVCPRQRPAWGGSAGLRRCQPGLQTRLLPSMPSPISSPCLCTPGRCCRTRCPPGSQSSGPGAQHQSHPSTWPSQGPHGTE